MAVNTMGRLGRTHVNGYGGTYTPNFDTANFDYMSIANLVAEQARPQVRQILQTQKHQYITDNARTNTRNMDSGTRKAMQRFYYRQSRVANGLNGG